MNLPIAFLILAFSIGLFFSCSPKSDVTDTAEEFDWEAYPVPAGAGEGKTWALQEDVSDEFNYRFEPTADRANIGDGKWFNFYHNHWDGPGSTYWQHDHVAVEGGNLVLRASRSSKTEKMGVPGVTAGCVTGHKRVGYPVFVEACVSVADISLASDVWLLSADDTQEIDIMECYGGADNGNAYFAQYIHLSHHSFVRKPFTDYQPRDKGSWWGRDGVNSWGAYCWNDGNRKFVRVAVNWVSPKHFEYYVDGELVRVLFENAFATKGDGQWRYTYPTMTTGKLDGEKGVQKAIVSANSKDYDFERLREASGKSGVSAVDPYGFQGGQGLHKEMDIIINVESQDWHVAAGRTPGDAELSDPAKNTMLIDWIRVYKPVDASGRGGGR